MLRRAEDFVEEDFGNGMMKEGKFLVSLAGWIRDIIGFWSGVKSVNH